MKHLLLTLLFLLSFTLNAQDRKQIIYNYSVAISVTSEGLASKPTEISSRVFLYHNSDNKLRIYLGNGVASYNISKEFSNVTKDGQKYKGYLLSEIGTDKVALFQVFNDNIARLILEDGSSYELINEI